MNIENIINTLTQSTDIPLLTAFALGVLTAINPCQLAINISALTYEYRNGKSLREAITYTLGRLATYTMLGILVICLVGGGRNIDSIQNLLAKGEVALPYVLITLGIYMVIRGFHHHHHTDDCHNSGRIIRRNGPLGSFMLGMALALAFCPESAVLYFGILIPMSVSTTIGILLPFIFGLGASIPVITIALLMTKAEANLNKLNHRFETMQTWINRIIGVLFIFFGTSMLIYNT